MKVYLIFNMLLIADQSLGVLKGFIIVTFSILESFVETKSEKQRITLTKIFTCLTYKTLQLCLVFLKQFLEHLQVYLTL